jgi:hypothetical protein
MKKLILMLLSGYSYTYAQTPAEVASKVEVGTQSVYFVKETGTEEYYKTVVTSENTLVNGQPLEINQTTRPDSMVMVTILGSSSTVLAKKVKRNKTSLMAILDAHLPINTDGILYFENKKHLAEVYNLLSMIIAATRGNDGTMKVIRNFNDKFPNYTSFTEYYEGKYDFVNVGYTSQQVETIEKEDFINDEILKTFVNGFRFIGIGDSIYYSHQEDVGIAIHKSKLSLHRALLESISVAETNGGYDVFDHSKFIYQSLDFTYISKNKQKIRPNPKGLYIVYTFNGKVVYQSEPFLTQAPESCNQFKKAIRIKLTYEVESSTGTGPPAFDYVYVNTPADFDLFGVTNTQLTINWNDGTPVEIINDYRGTNIFHTYSSEGNYNPSTVYKFVRNGVLVTLYDGIQSQSNTQINFNINGVCGNSDISKYQSFESGVWRMDCKIWVNNNWLGSFVGSYTHAWKYASGGWRRRIANIYTNVTGKFRNDACVLGETKSGSDTENQERVQITKSKIFSKYKYFGNSEVYSEHWLSKNGTYISGSLSLTPCP